MYFQMRLFTVFIFIFKFLLLPRNKEYIRFEKNGVHHEIHFHSNKHFFSFHFCCSESS